MNFIRPVLLSLVALSADGITLKAKSKLLTVEKVVLDVPSVEDFLFYAMDYNLSEGFQSKDVDLSRFDDAHEASFQTLRTEDSQWEVVESQTYPASLNLCKANKQLPSAYIIGMPKCGTTSLATDMHKAGIVYLGNFKETKAKTGPEISEKSPPCESAVRQVVMGASPDRMWYQDPSLITSLYGSMSNRINFIVMMREPLSRMVSFLVEIKGALRDGDEIEQAFAARMTQESSYGMYLQKWMRYFPEKQFYMIPMKVYLQQSQQVAKELSSRLQFDMANPLGVPASTNERHTSPEESLHLSSARLNLLKAKARAYFANDKDLLIDQLVDGHRKGMSLAAYQGRSGSRDDIETWLESNW